MPNKPHMLSHVLDHLKTQEMCDKVVNHNPWQLEYVPNHLKTQEMCNKVVGWHLCLLLEHVPYWFITQQQIKIGMMTMVPWLSKTQVTKSKNKRRTPAHCLAFRSCDGVVYVRKREEAMEVRDSYFKNYLIQKLPP